MITTIYECDRCHAKQDTQDQMWNIGIYIGHIGNSLGYTLPRGLWCRRCIEEVGLLPPAQHAEDKTLPPPPLTLEELIRELIRSEIKEAQ